MKNALGLTKVLRIAAALLVACAVPVSAQDRAPAQDRAGSPAAEKKEGMERPGRVRVVRIGHQIAGPEPVACDPR